MLVPRLPEQERERHAVTQLDRNGRVAKPRLAELARCLATGAIHFPAGKLCRRSRVHDLKADLVYDLPQKRDRTPDSIPGRNRLFVPAENFLLHGGDDTGRAQSILCPVAIAVPDILRDLTGLLPSSEPPAVVQRRVRWLPVALPQPNYAFLEPVSGSTVEARGRAVPRNRRALPHGEHFSSRMHAQRCARSVRRWPQLTCNCRRTVRPQGSHVPWGSWTHVQVR